MARKPRIKPIKRRKNHTAKGVVVGLGAFCVVAAGYGAYEFRDVIWQTDKEHAQVKQAWYKSQPPAPKMIRLPDAPLILAEKEAEVDETVRILTPQKPLKKPITPIQPVEPRSPTVDISAKPAPPAPIYEEALPQEVYTPTRPLKQPVIKAEQPSKTLETTIEKAVPRWLKYAYAMETPINRPMIALVIDDLGLDQRRTAQTLELPGPLTMAFIPYAKNLSRQTATAKARGHELMVHLPMEPMNAKIDAGPNHLHTHLAHEDLLDRIHWNLERFDGYVGVNNHMGSRATTDPAVMRTLLSELGKREILFLDSRTNAKSVAATLAHEMGVPFAERNVFLDNVNERNAVLKQLSLLERVAAKSGFAVGIGHPRDATIAALKNWIPEAQKRGFVFVPISQIVMKNEGLS